jgi:hypothetical protein
MRPESFDDEEPQPESVHPPSGTQLSLTQYLLGRVPKDAH